MNRILTLMAVTIGLQACGPSEPPGGGGEPRAKAPVEETRQAEKASEAGKPLTDQSLNQIIRSALESESSLDARKIDVENRNGNVALHGTVASEEQREKAGRIVSAVGGVRDVQNNLAVDPTAATGGTAGPTTGGTAGPTSGAPATIPQRKD